MSPDDLPSTGDSPPEDPTLPLPSVESTFQVNLPDRDPGVDLEKESKDPTSARLEKLAGQRTQQRYVLKGEVGRGGMGAVLKVFDTDLRRNLAMKLILGKEDPASRDTPEVRPDQLARFLEEAQVTGQLDHPGVVPVHELGVDQEGRVYFTMRLVKGEELSRIIEKVHAGDGEWNMTRALGVLLKVCEAMSYAHDKRVVHRDLKPSNVMVGRHGEVYVMDWGLARVEGREDSRDLRLRNTHTSLSEVRTDREDAKEDLDSPLVTRDGAVVGTPYYMPPEQAAGRVEELGPRSDVYSLGAMLYHLIGGHMPYYSPGDRPSAHTVLAMVLHGPPRSVSELAPEGPPELVAICEKAMAREPRNRYADMGELADDLRAFLENRVVQAYRTGALVELKKWMVRNRALSFALQALIVLGLVFVWRQNANIKEIRAERDLRIDTEYASNLRAADLSMLMNETGEAKRRLASADEDLRQWEWHHLDLRSDSSVHRFEGHSGRVGAIAFSRDGSLMATGSDDGTIRLWDWESRAFLRLLEGHDGSIAGVAFGPDGALLVSISNDRRACLWNTRTATIEHEWSLEIPPTAVALAPDGSRVAFGDKKGGIEVWDTTTRELVHRLAVEGGSRLGQIIDLAYTSAGDRLFSADGIGGLHAWNTTTGEALNVREWPARSFHALAVDPQGTLVATASFKTIAIHDARTFEILRSLHGHAGLVDTLDFSPDGSQLLSGSSDNTVRVWAPGSGAELLQRFGHEDDVESVAFHPDGVHFVSGSEDDSARAWHVGSGAVARLTGHEARVNAVAIGPDGEIASGSLDQTVRLWDDRTGESRRVFETSNAVACIAFHPQGGYLAHDAGNGRVRVLALESGESRELTGFEGYAAALAYSAAGNRLLARGSEGALILWDAETGEQLFAIQDDEGPFRSLAFRHDDERFASGTSDGRVRIWDAEDGELVRTIPVGDRPITSLAYDVDDAWLGCGSADGSIALWSIEREEIVLRLEGHEGWVTSIDFYSETERLVSGSRDATVRVWDVRSGELLLTLREQGDIVTDVAFSHDGTQIVSASEDRTLRLYRTRTAR